MSPSSPFQKSPLTSRLNTTEGLKRCRTHGLHYDPAVYRGCIICRSREMDAATEKRSRFPFFLVALFCMGAGIASLRYGAPQTFKRMVLAMQAVEPADDFSEAPLGEEGTADEAMEEPAPEVTACDPKGDPKLDSSCAAETVGELADGHATFFLPTRRPGQKLPLLVLLHGPDVSGRHMLNLFQPLAAHRRFAVLAPESGRVASGELAWQVADQAGKITSDGRRVLDSLDELDALPGVVFDRARTTIAGHSVSAAAACDLATHRPEFASFALLHGAAYRKAIGTRHVRGWVSTGRNDPIYSLNDATRNVAELRASGNDVVLHSFPGGHGISSVEAQTLIDWWLGETS